MLLLYSTFYTREKHLLILSNESLENLNQLTILIYVTGSSSIPSWPQLSVDPTMSLFRLSSVILSTTELNQLQFPSSYSPSASTLVVVAEGIPPVSCKLVEKIRKLKYVDLSTLLGNNPSLDQLTLINGQLAVVSSTSQKHHQSKPVLRHCVLASILPPF